MAQAVLFDIDGTLVDSNDYHVEAWREVMRENGHDVSAERLRGQIGKGGDLLVPSVLPGIDDAEAERLAERHGEVFKRRYLPLVRPFTGARDLVARAKEAGLKVVLASSAKQAEVDHYVRLLMLDGLIDATTCIDDVDTSKPAPDIFAAAIDKVPVEAGDAVVVGDTPYDMDAARKCGIAGVGLRSGGFDDAALREAGATAIYDDAGDLLARFEGSPLAPR